MNNIKDWQAAIIGISALLLGMATTGFSAYYSAIGYTKTFATIPGASGMGVVFTMAAFLSVAALTFYFLSKKYFMFTVATLFACLTISIDMLGNYQALNSDNREIYQNFSDRTARFETATNNLVLAQDEADTLKEHFAVVQTATNSLSVVQSADEKPETLQAQKLLQAQQLLKLLGFYSGKIDGEFGDLTELSFENFGTYFVKRSEELSKIIAESSSVIAEGPPIAVETDRDNRTIIVAVALSIISAFLSVLASSMMYIARGLDRVAAEEAADDLEDEQVYTELERQLAALRAETGVFVQGGEVVKLRV